MWVARGVVSWSSLMDRSQGAVVSKKTLTDLLSLQLLLSHPPFPGSRRNIEEHYDAGNAM